MRGDLLNYLSNTEDGQETNNEEAPENNSQYTTVYVGNLSPEVLLFSPFFFRALHGKIVAMH